MEKTMIKPQFNQCIYLAGKSFNVQAAGDDKKLSKTELDAMCREAETFIQGVYPNDEISITPFSDSMAEFAGFDIVSGEHEERVEFNFGALGVDVE